MCQEGRKTRIFVHTISFGQNFLLTKTVQTTKHYKNRGFSGNWPKPKRHLFFRTRCFLIWSKNWVLLTVFLKSCVFFVFCFFWRVYGSGEVAQRATSLGPKPSLLLFFVIFVVFSLCFFVFVCFFCFCFLLFFLRVR